MTERLLVRVDAGKSVGSGHVMRCIALAQAWITDGGSAIFVSSDLPEALRDRLSDEQISLIETERPRDPEELARLAIENDANWVVLDLVSLEGSYPRFLRKRGLRVLQWDDMGFDQELDVDILLNQNIHAVRSLYPKVRGELLLGTKFVALRREFLDGEEGRTRRSVLVSLGGAPSQDVLSMILGSLERSVDVRRLIVVAGHHGNRMFAPPGVVAVADPRDMAAAMRTAVLAVSAAGSTCWELCFCGVPQVLFTLSEDQEPIARGLEEAGCAVDLGAPRVDKLDLLAGHIRRLLESTSERERMGLAGERLIDGKGAMRIVKAMRSR